MSDVALAEVEETGNAVGESEAGAGVEVSEFSIDRTELQKSLMDLKINVSSDDLAAMAESHVQELFNWRQEFPEVDSEGFENWFTEELPYFMEISETIDDIRQIYLAVKDGEGGTEVEASSDPSPKIEVDELTVTKKHLALIKEASTRAKRLRNLLESAESDVRAAKGREKECRENLDNAEKELGRIIDDAKSGQQQLPFDEENAGSTGVGGTAVYVNGVKSEFKSLSDAAGFIVDDARKELGSTFPISELSAKSIKKTVGTDVFNAAKAADDPIGLSDSQLEKFSQVDVSTVEGLEKFIRDDAFWHQKIKGFGDAAIQRVISTLVAFRKVNPQ